MQYEFTVERDMKKIISPSKNEILRKFEEKDSHKIKFKINPEKKSHLESIVSERRTRVANVLREWLRKDKYLLIKKKKD